MAKLSNIYLFYIIFILYLYYIYIIFIDYGRDHLEEKSKNIKAKPSFESVVARFGEWRAWAQFAHAYSRNDEVFSWKWCLNMIQWPSNTVEWKEETQLKKLNEKQGNDGKKKRRRVRRPKPKEQKPVRFSQRLKNKTKS